MVTILAVFSTAVGARGLVALAALAWGLMGNAALVGLGFGGGTTGDDVRDGGRIVEPTSSELVKEVEDLDLRTPVPWPQSEGAA
jgi:hypothetical protein